MNSKTRIAIRLCSFILLYGILSVASHLYLSMNPRKLCIVIDTSYAMEKYQNDIFEKVDSLTTRRYTEFSLVSDKSIIYSWTASPQATRSLKFYGPDDFSRINTDDNPLLAEADYVVLISNSDKAQQLKSKLRHVQIVRL